MLPRFLRDDNRIGEIGASGMRTADSAVWICIKSLAADF